MKTRRAVGEQVLQMARDTCRAADIAVAPWLVFRQPASAQPFLFAPALDFHRALVFADDDSGHGHSSVMEKILRFGLGGSERQS